MRSHIPPIEVTQRPPKIELPYQTWERVFSMPWPGGKSVLVRSFLVAIDSQNEAGTAEANIELQNWIYDHIPVL
jgi:hypothetical protein